MMVMKARPQYFPTSRSWGGNEISAQINATLLKTNGKLVGAV